MAAAARSEKRSDAGRDERPFWATVNICDTKDSPNALGVRTSVPGNGSNQRIFGRYTAQWWSGAKQKWLTVGGSGVTDWVLIGSADMATRQAGWTFRFVEPPEGTTYVMRGVVELQWRDPALARRQGRAARSRTARPPPDPRAHRTSAPPSCATAPPHRDGHEARAGRRPRRPLEGHVPHLVATA